MILYEILANAAHVVATLDYDDSQCFECGKYYYCTYRKTTDITSPVAVGIALTNVEGSTHYGWIKEICWAAIDVHLAADKCVLIQVVKLGRRWTRQDRHLGQDRQLRLGEAKWEVVEEVESNVENDV